MNDNEKNNNLTDNSDDNEKNIDKSSLPEQDEDTEYMLQLLAERKRGRTANQTQTIERPVVAQNQPKPKPQVRTETKPEPSQAKPRRLYDQDERERDGKYQSNYQTEVEKVTKLPVVPIILGLVVVAIIVALITNLIDRNPASDTPDDSQGASQINNEKYTVPDWITVNLLPKNDQSRPGIALDTINGAVVHYIGNAGTSAEQNRNYFAGLANSKDVYASSNFIIGIDGEILMIVPPDEVAYCSNDRNYDTLSIECCHPDDTGEFTEETYQSLIKLLAWMCQEFDFKPSDIIRHYDVTGKECPKDYVVNPEKWDQLLTDVESALK